MRYFFHVLILIVNSLVYYLVSYISTSKSQWLKGIRGIHSSGGNRMKGASSYLPKKQEHFFAHHPHPLVPSERVFSEVSAIYDKRRSKLTGEHAEQLCFLHHNLVLLDWDY